MKPEETIFDGISDSEMESFCVVILGLKNVNLNNLSL